MSQTEWWLGMDDRKQQGEKSWNLCGANMPPKGMYDPYTTMLDQALWQETDAVISGICPGRACCNCKRHRSRWRPFGAFVQM